MSKAIDEIHKSLREYEKTPEGRKLALRMDLSLAVITAMKRRGWDCETTADKAGVSEQVMSAVINGELSVTMIAIFKVLEEFERESRPEVDEEALVKAMRDHRNFAPTRLLLPRAVAMGMRLQRAGYFLAGALMGAATTLWLAG